MDFDLEIVLKEKKISKYELAKNTNVPYSTIHDICSFKKKIENITFRNALKIFRYIYSEKELLVLFKTYN